MEFLDAVRKLDDMIHDLNEHDPPELRLMFPNTVEVVVALVC
jgi:hypothetical protein